MRKQTGYLQGRKSWISPQPKFFRAQKPKPTTDSEDRCLHFLEETSLLHWLHAADIVKVGGDDNQERYEVGADGFYKIGYVELFLTTGNIQWWRHVPNFRLCP